MEAMAKLKDGQKFNEVASVYSEDKARQGVCTGIMNKGVFNMYDFLLTIQAAHDHTTGTFTSFCSPPWTGC